MNECDIYIYVSNIIAPSSAPYMVSHTALIQNTFGKQTLSRRSLSCIRMEFV